MRTLEGQTLAAGLGRDLRLLWRIGTMLYQYATVGRRVRREYRRRQANGEIYWVDAAATLHREEALRRR